MEKAQAEYTEEDAHYDAVYARALRIEELKKKRLKQEYDDAASLLKLPKPILGRIKKRKQERENIL